MRTITDIDENGNTVYKLVDSFSARVVEDQERAIMSAVDQALGNTGYTIGKKQLIELLDRDNEKPVIFGREYARCPKCCSALYNPLSKFCNYCGQRVTFDVMEVKNECKEIGYINSNI